MRSWKLLTLDSVATVVNGYSFKSGDFSVENDIPSIKITNVGVQEFIEETDKFLPRDYKDKYSNYLADAGDIVIALTRTIISAGLKVAIVPARFDGSLINQRVAAIRTESTILNKTFLYYYFTSTVALDYVKSTVNELMQPNLSVKDLKSFKIPCPPIPEQKRIVTILDHAFADIEKARANAEQNLKNARELFESYLQQVFGQRGEGWEVKRVSEIADTCLGKMLDERKNKGELKPYLRNLNVQWFDINTNDLLLMRFEASEYERYAIKKGDLVVCEGGYPGRGAIWDRDEDIFFQKALHRIRAFKEIHNRWILYYLYFSDCNGSLKASFTGAGIQHLTGKALKQLSLPIHSGNQTELFVRKIDDLFCKVTELQSVYRNKLKLLNELKKSILQKAFTGELTKNKTSEENAA